MLLCGGFRFISIETCQSEQPGILHDFAEDNNHINKFQAFKSARWIAATTYPWLKYMGIFGVLKRWGSSFTTSNAFIPPFSFCEFQKISISHATFVSHISN
jgi:hypothetical protein